MTHGGSEIVGQLLTVRNGIAEVLYNTRFPHRKWAAASIQEHELTMKQADAVVLHLCAPAETQKG